MANEFSEEFSLALITYRCPKHGAILVWDETNQVWRCPRPGCFYTKVAPPPEEPVE